ncbi:MAG: hypothetical protein NVSMB5_19650 [Candidatus Velthaea sp.]
MLKALMIFRLALRRSNRFESGQALAEIALITPLLLLLLIGSIEYGRYMHFGIMIGNAARAGVQYGSQNAATAADVAGMQTAALVDAENLSGVTATASSYCKCADGTTSTCAVTDCSASHRLTYVQVLTAGTFTSILSYPGIAGSLAINAQATMQVSP